MRRADRLFQIVQLLRGGRLVTAAQLAEELEVSKRTIYRDVSHLIGSGVPIDGEAGMGYVLSLDYDMPPLAFTSEEIVALVAGARAILAYGGEKMGRAAREALVKIEAVSPEAMRSRFREVSIHALSSIEISDQTRRLLDQLEIAEHQRQRLEIKYGDQSDCVTMRIVRPLGLFFWGKVWTLVAWCELRNDFRTFRVDRIGSIRTLDHFLTHPSQSLQSFFAQEQQNCSKHGANFG